jgi:hypothetical protein
MKIDNLVFGGPRQKAVAMSDRLRLRSERARCHTASSSIAEVSQTSYARSSRGACCLAGDQKLPLHRERV